MDQVKTAAAAVDGVKDVDVEMATATLRVYANVAPESTAESETATADAIYKAVSGILDPTVYFTKTDTEKMYDMEIHVYNEAERTDAEGDNFVYVIETKTSSMSAPAAQVVSTAKDPTLAQQLRDDVAARLAEEAANNANNGTGTTPDNTADTTTTDATATPAE
jgi:copper chaperone CopZ